MVMHTHKITIINIRRPKQSNLNENLQYFGNALGLFNLRDKDKSCFRIFIELLKAARFNIGFTSDELAYKLSLTRGTVVHHLNKLIESGIVISEKNRYFLRVANLQELVDELMRDVERTGEQLRAMAKEIDESMGL